jgi:hypothetical protein
MSGIIERVTEPEVPRRELLTTYDRVRRTLDEALAELELDTELEDEPDLFRN